MRTTKRSVTTDTSKTGHPVIDRAAHAHHDDLVRFRVARPRILATEVPATRVPAPRTLHWSPEFLGEARRAGVSELDLRATLGSGKRHRRWDGCVLVSDRFLGVEVQLDPTERFGMAVRRVD